MTTPLLGGCLCGSIRYRVDFAVRDLRACHCTHCQKWSGSGISINAIVPAQQFTLLQGEPKAFRDTGDSGRHLFRHFCAECGSSLYAQREDMPDSVFLRAGTLDNPVGMRITSHIWMSSSRNWVGIDPEVPQHPQGAPSPAASKQS